MELFKCPNCNDKFEQLPDLLNHIEEDHSDSIPKDQTSEQYYYMMRTGKTHGNCIVCKRPTKWKEATGKYHRFCGRVTCNETYRKTFQDRMIGTYGKVTLLKDPSHQKKMLANRSISGRYKWSDGKEFVYTGSYELDFLKFLDLFMGFDSDDVMAPSPHTYYYKYNGEEKFYMPDFFIPSLNLEIEVKDSAINNPNTHHKIQAVDKVKEKLKDGVLLSQKQFSYIKVLGKEYDNFFDILMTMKKQVSESGEFGQIFNLGDGAETIVKGPVKESLLAEEFEMDSGTMREIIKSVDSSDVLNHIKENVSMPPELIHDIDNSIAIINKSFEDIVNEIDSITNEMNLEVQYHKIDDYFKEKGFLSVFDRRPGFAVPGNGNIFLNIVESFVDGVSLEDIEQGDSCRDFKRALSNNGTPDMLKVYQRDKKAMKYYFKLLAGKLDSRRLDIVNFDSYLDDIVTEATFKVEGIETYPVYVLLTHSGTFLSNAIKAVTKNPYSHASIAFDESLDEMYSFGRKYKDNPLIGTFVSESIKKGLYADVQETAAYSLYVTFVTKSQMDAIKKRLSYFQEDGVNFKYSFRGLINYKLGKESNSVDSFFCSQFVDHVLSAGKQYFDRHSSLVEPTDFSKHKDFHFVSKGKLNEYDSNKVLRRVNGISRKVKLDSDTKKDKVVFIGLTSESIKHKRVTINSDGNSNMVALPTSLQELDDMITTGKSMFSYTHYTVVPLSKLKISATVVKDKHAVLVNLPLDIKITNVNKI